MDEHSRLVQSWERGLFYTLGALVIVALMLISGAQQISQAGPLATCGDGICQVGESAQSCPKDCGILLVDEDFEDGQVQGWQYDAQKWQIISDGGSQVWSSTEEAWASTGSIAWSDYILFLRLRRMNSDANLYFRINQPNSYALRVESSRVVLWTERTGAPQDLQSANVAMGTTWHNLRIDVIGAQITVTVDSAPVLTYTDGISASPRGGIGLEAYAADGTRFDDVQLYSTVPQCYNGLKDGDETGVDCGGSCLLQDCCTNRAQDSNLGEGGVDCGGACSWICQPAERQDRWTQTNGPWLEYIRRIRFDPDDPDKLIISSNTGSGVVKSSDAGMTWHEISDGISPMNVFGLAMDPEDKDILYAGTANGRLFGTTDGGHAWDLLWEYSEGDDALWTVEVDPANRDRLFVGMGDYTGCDGRIYRSEDRGQSWDKVLDVDPSSANDGGFISHIAFDPVVTTTLYATTGIGDWCGGTNPGDPNAFSFGIYKSTNGGDTWFPINNGLEDLTVSHLVIDPTNPQTLYAGVGCVDDATQLSGNVFKSINGGANWQRLEVSPVNPITRLALHPSDPQKVYALGYSGVFYSEDGGVNWEKLDETFKSAVYTFFYEHVFAPDEPDTMYVGTYAGGIIKSLDGGKNWFEINGLRHQGDVLANSYGMALDPADPDTLYATTIGGIHKTTDGGEHWDFIGKGIFQHLRQIAIDPVDPDRLYLGGDSTNFYTSDDGGQNWDHSPLDQVDLGGDPQFPIIAVNPQSPNNILAGLSGSPDILMRSSDYGQSWQGVAPLGILGSTYALAYHPTISGTVYAGTGWQPDDPHLIRSTNNGQTWQDAAPGLNLVTVYRMAELGDRLYAATNGSGLQMGWAGGTGVWEGLNFISSGHGLSYITQLASDSSGSGKLLAYDKGDHTLYRHEAPDTPEEAWQASLHLSDVADDLHDLSFDPHNANRGYAISRLGGFWRSDNGGETWAQKNLGLPTGEILRGLAVDQVVADRLYVGQMGAPGRIYRSLNGGNNWLLLNNELTFSTIHAFARHPSNPDVAYAGVWGGGTWKTEDGGDTWSLLAEAPVSAAALAVDPRDPQVIYATDRTEPTLWQSDDGGVHWWRRFNTGPGYSRLQALAIDYHQPDTVYVSAFKHGGYGIDGSLFRVGWKETSEITHSLPRVVISLATAPDEPGLILASTHVYGLYRSQDYGKSWQVVDESDGLPKVGYNAMAWDPTSGVLYGGACSGSFPSYMLPPGLPNGDDQPGIYRSLDDGVTWQKVLAGVVGKGFDFTPGGVYAATESGIYLSKNGGGNWVKQSGGPKLAYATVAVGDGKLYVGTLGGGVHLANVNPDLSLSWQGSQGPQAEIHAIQITSVPERPNTLFATSFPGGVFKSTDGGSSWKEANFGLPGFTLPDPERNGYYSLAVNPADPDNLYLGIYGYGVYRSDDAAATWLPANSGLGNRFIYSLLVEADGSHIWAGTNDGMNSLWRSATDTPGRLNWSVAPAYPTSYQAITGILINPEQADEITIAAFPAGVFTTFDGGLSWYERSNNLYVGKLRTHGVGFEDGYYQLALDPLNPRHFFFGTYTAQTYETRDGGKSWSTFDQGLMREGSIYDFEITGDGTRLYISQKAGGVLRRALDPTFPQTHIIAANGALCTDGSNVYTTVASALADSNSGDTLVVCPGTYVENVILDKSVRLESFSGPGSTQLQSVTITADDACLAGFRLRDLRIQGAENVELLGNLLIDSEIYLPILLRIE